MDAIKVYQGSDGTYTVAEYGTWVPGVYATKEAAIAAAKLSPVKVNAMWYEVLESGRITATLADVGAA